MPEKKKKYKTMVYVEKEPYLELRSKLVLKNVSVSSWVQAQIDNYLAKENGETRERKESSDN